MGRLNHRTAKCENPQCCCSSWLPTDCNDGVMFMPKSLCKSAYSPRCHARIIADQGCQSHLLKSHLTREWTPISKYEQISMSKVHHYLFIDINNICKAQHLSISRQFVSVFPRTSQHRKWLCSSFSYVYLLSESVVSFKPNIHLGLTELTKAPLWSAPIQWLIKAAFNEGSLIDTAGLASPLAGINDGSHMMRLMTGSQAGGWQDGSARPPPRLIVARFCARVTQQDSPSFDFWASVECFHDEKTYTEFLGVVLV